MGEPRRGKERPARPEVSPQRLQTAALTKGQSPSEEQASLEAALKGPGRELWLRLTPRASSRGQAALTVYRVC